MLAMDYKAGMTMMDERSYAENEAFFQDVLEIARRHKIMNPEKMRTEYAKVRVFRTRSAFFYACHTPFAFNPCTEANETKS